MSQILLEAPEQAEYPSNEFMQEVPNAEGPEGVMLRSQFEVIARAWSSREPERPEFEDIDEEVFDYNHIPLKTYKKIKVRYRIAGRLGPRKVIPKDDEP
jgi:hypothetical protein